MNFKFCLALIAALFFMWGFYADYSVQIAQFFAGNHVNDISKAGAWGDTFGAFNGFVSLAGALFIIRTLILQQESLKEQQKSLETQIKENHKQRFESTFFELLKLLREVRNELSFRHSAEYIKLAPTENRKILLSQRKIGVDALTYFLTELMSNVKAEVGSLNAASREDFSRIYDSTMKHSTEKTFSPYFRLIYTILKKVSSDNILNNDEKNAYARLLRSQLTNVELVAIAYNALSPRSADLEALVTECRLFKYMPASPGRSRIERLFDALAFQPRD